MADETRLVIDCSDPDAVPVEVPLTPEEIEARDIARADEAVRVLGIGQDQQADLERLRIIRERAETDPAYAALADLALRGITP